MVKKRGTFLTVALVLMTIDAIISAVLPFVYHRDTVDITRPWLIAAALAVGLVGVAGVVLMWLWKRLGIYLFLASVAGSIAVGLVVYPSGVRSIPCHDPVADLGRGTVERQQNAVV